MRHSTFFYHHRFSDPRKRGVTFAIEPVFKDIEEKQFSHLLVGYSICSIKDQFSKKFGREQALKKEPVNLTIRELPDYIAEVLTIQQNKWKFNYQDFAWIVLKFI